MNYREKLKESQKQGGSSFPKLSIDVYLDLKEAEAGVHKGKPSFKYWDKLKTENFYSIKPITGVFIGQAFKCSAFDEKYGKNGGSYTSAQYLRSNNITIFSPNAKSKADMFTGSKDEVAAWLAKQGVGDKISVKYCILIATASGLTEVLSNTVLTIDQFGKIAEEDLINNKIILTPVLYNPEDETISKDSHKMLGKFASKNPPKYVTIKIGDPITDEDVEMFEIEKHVDNYLAWKKYKLGDGADGIAVEEKSGEVEGIGNPPKDDSGFPPNIPPPESDSGDLPF